MERETKTTPVAEIWRPIRDWEGIYEVSDLGRVRSLDRWIEYISKYGKPYKVWTKGRILALKISKGYCLAHLSYQGKAIHKTVHRLVAEAFIPNPDNLPEINHKDENTTNNAASNLEWCEQLYNIHYGTGIERRASKKRKVIAKYTKDGTYICTYDSVIAAANSVGKGRSGTGLISSCANHKTPSAYGYIWRYV